MSAMQATAGANDLPAASKVWTRGLARVGPGLACVVRGEYPRVITAASCLENREPEDIECVHGVVRPLDKRRRHSNGGVIEFRDRDIAVMREDETLYGPLSIFYEAEPFRVTDGMQRLRRPGGFLGIPRTSFVWMFSFRHGWFEADVFDERARAKATLGSPVLDQNGSAIAVITSPGCWINLAGRLPGWLWEELMDYDRALAREPATL